MKDNVNRKIEKAADDETKLFSDGSVVVRPDGLPWTPMGLEGVEFKLMNVDWDRHMYIMLQRVRADAAGLEHYHYGVAHAFVVEGDFNYEYGHMVSGAYLYEASDIFHDVAAGPNGVTVMAIVFDGIGRLGADGKPDLEGALDCQAVYNLAKENSAADHIPPPPASFKKMDRWGHAEQYDMVA
jgi:hypothetical protein